MRSSGVAASRTIIVVGCMLVGVDGSNATFDCAAASPLTSSRTANKAPATNGTRVIGEVRSGDVVVTTGETAKSPQLPRPDLEPDFRHAPGVARGAHDQLERTDAQAIARRRRAVELAREHFADRQARVAQRGAHAVAR